MLHYNNSTNDNNSCIKQAPNKTKDNQNYIRSSVAGLYCTKNWYNWSANKLHNETMLNVLKSNL
jgi:hypothetical protein